MAEIGTATVNVVPQIDDAEMDALAERLVDLIVTKLAARGLYGRAPHYVYPNTTWPASPANPFQRWHC